MDTAKFIYNVILPDKNKERFEMILEPLQAMTQLALLSYCPIGSKLSICNNILCIQTPTWRQSLTRRYNADKKNDLVFLFNVIKRFHKFYNFIKLNDDEHYTELFDILIEHSTIGIANLIQTYNKSDGDHLSQTLRMYIQLVKNPDTFDELTPQDSVNIDTVFKEITNLYSKEHYSILFSTFNLLKNDPDEYETYINSINSMTEPINKSLKLWISNNIVF